MMKTWTTKDKSEWPRGEWDNEPDKAHWIDPDTGLDCLIVRGPMGALCGYVGVPKDHPCFGKDYDSVDVNAHGGLTFADFCDDESRECEGICHSEKYAANEVVWWLGFDCAHGWDVIPKSEWSFSWDAIYRNFEYVVSEVTSLAHQLARGAGTNAG